MRDDLKALLEFIRGEGDFGRHFGGCITSWPEHGEGCNVHRGCLELEQMRLIYRAREHDDGRIVWRAVEGN